MLSLLAVALGITAATANAAAAGPRPQTLLTQPGTTISAFTQDGALIAWLGSAHGRCNSVHVRSLANGLEVSLPSPDARNVTCRWEIGSSTATLALAGSRALWTLSAQTPIPFDYLLGAAVGNRIERRYQEVAHTKSGSGLWLGGVSGDGPTLVYGVTSVDYEDEAGCLAGTSSCTMHIVGGGVYRMAERPTLVPGTESAGVVTVAAADRAVAYVPATAVGVRGRPAPGANAPVDVVDATTGAEISTVRPAGEPVAVALTGQVLATLERTPIGQRIAWYARSTGQPLGSLPVSGGAAHELAASDRAIVYRVGRSIRAVDVVSGKARTLARAAATPVGLSLEGSRLAWAENLNGTARIRTLTVTQ